MRFVVSDPSTYLYFTRERPYKTLTPTGALEVTFKVPLPSPLSRPSPSPRTPLSPQVPDPSWTSHWPWIGGWAVDCASTYCCAEYNEWRFGLDNLSGYYARYIGLR